MATLGVKKKANLLHVVLDNQVHDSTGGQLSGSEHVNFALIAKACGHEHILETNHLSLLNADCAILDAGSGKTMAMQE